jgi:hypothetical protein
VIREVERVFGPVRVQRFRDDAPVARGRAVEPAQQPARARAVREQAEVVAHHEHGVEPAQARAHPVDGQQARVAYAAQPADLDRERRDVDRDDLVPPLLQVQRDAAGAAADVERAPARTRHGLARVRRPVLRAPEVIAGR